MIPTEDIVRSVTEDRSKTNIEGIVEAIYVKGMDFEELFKVIAEQKEPVNWRLTWMLSHLMQEHPELGTGIEHHIWNQLKNTKHEGMLRDLWRALSFISLPDDLAGAVFDEACRVIRSAQYPIAVRAHAMKCAFVVAVKFPDLSEELKLILEELQHDESAGIKSRSRNLVKSLKKKAGS